MQYDKTSSKVKWRFPTHLLSVTVLLYDILNSVLKSHLSIRVKRLISTRHTDTFHGCPRLQKNITGLFFLHCDGAQLYYLCTAN